MTRCSAHRPATIGSLAALASVGLCVATALAQDPTVRPFDLPWGFQGGDRATVLSYGRGWWAKRGTQSIVVMREVETPYRDRLLAIADDQKVGMRTLSESVVDVAGRMAIKVVVEPHPTIIDWDGKKLIQHPGPAGGYVVIVTDLRRPPAVVVGRSPRREEKALVQGIRDVMKRVGRLARHAYDPPPPAPSVILSPGAVTTLSQGLLTSGAGSMGSIVDIVDGSAVQSSCPVALAQE